MDEKSLSEEITLSKNWWEATKCSNGSEVEPLTIDKLQELYDSIPKLPKRPDIVYYIESEFIPDDYFFRIPSGQEKDVIIFQPSLKCRVEEIFKELGIILEKYDYNKVYPAYYYRIIDGKLEIKNEHDEFWTMLSEAFNK